jgi:hypothetical protein
LPSEEIVYNKKMKVTKDLLVEILPLIVKILEDIPESDWTEENLKDKLVEFIKQR